MLKRFHKDSTHLNLAKAFNKVGYCDYNLGLFDKAIEYYSIAMEIYKKIYKDQDQSNLAALLHYFGNCHTRMGNLDKALEYYTESLSMFKRIYYKNDADSIEEAELMNSKAVCHEKRSAWQQALESRLEAFEIYKKVFISNGMPRGGISFNNRGKLKTMVKAIADLYQKLGDFNNADLYRANIGLIDEHEYDFELNSKAYVVN